MGSAITVIGSKKIRCEKVMMPRMLGVRIWTKLVTKQVSTVQFLVTPEMVE